MKVVADSMFIDIFEQPGKVNRSIPAYLVEKPIDVLNDLSKAVNDARILVLGIAYKKNVGDMRDSPLGTIMELLRKKVAEVSSCVRMWLCSPRCESTASIWRASR